MPVEEVDRPADQLHPADALEDMVGAGRQDVPDAVHRGQEVGRAELPGRRLLRRVRVHGHDPERPGDARALQDVQPDAAGADDDHAVPAVHPRPVEDRTDPGEHPAADQRRRLQRDVLRDPHRLHGLHDRAFREGRVGGELVHRPPAPREGLLRTADRPAAHRRAAPVALRTGAAVGERGQGHVVAGGHMGHARSHGLDQARALVAQHHGDREGDGAVHHRKVAVAQPGRRDRHQHLTGLRLPHRQVVHHLDLFAVEHHTTHHTTPFGSLGRPSTRSAMIVRWTWSEPP